MTFKSVQRARRIMRWKRLYRRILCRSLAVGDEGETRGKRSESARIVGAGKALGSYAACATTRRVSSRR